MSSRPTGEIVATDRDDALTEEVGAPGVFDLADELRPGERIGRYHILEPIGRGGMGAVFAAYDPGLERRVALKVLHRSKQRSSALRERLVHEAKAMARLSHPNVVAVHEVGMHREHVFLAMEYVRGKTIRAWMKEAPRSWREVAAVFRDAALGLGAAHAAGIVHRDCKPDNVIVGEDGRARLTDFGIAMEAADSSSRGTSSDEPQRPAPTRTTATGTPAYMSPEQLRGEAVDAASDQFSLCVAWFEAMCGERPFSGHTAAELRDAMRRGPVGSPIGDAPRWLHAIVLRGLSLDPGDRWESMDTLVRELDARLSPVRRPIVRVAGLVAVAGIGAGFAVAAQLGDDDAESCEASLDEVWGDEQRSAVTRGLEATGHAFSASSARTTVALLDAYADAWTNAQLDACRTHVDGTQSDTLFDRRQACLRARQRAVGELVELLAAADGQTARHAIQAAEGLPSIAECDAYRLADDAAWSLPADPAVRLRHEEVLDGITRAQTLHRAGGYRDALEVADVAVAQARELDDPALLVRALLVQQKHLDKLEQREASLAALDEAWHLALRSGDTANAARAGVTLTLVLGYQERREDAALSRARDVDSLLARLEGGSPEQAAELRAELRRAEGLTVFRAGRTAHAVDLLAEAVALLRALPGRRKLEEAAYLNSLATAAFELRAYDLALMHYQAAFDLDVEVLGEEHPLVAGLHNNIGLLLKQLGRLDEAREHLEISYRISLDFLGPDHGDVHMAAVNLGSVHHMRRDHAAAVRYLEPVFGPPFTPAVDDVEMKRLLAFGDDLIEIDRAADSLAAFDAVLDWTREHDPLGHARAERSRARALDELDRPTEARAACEELARVLDRLPPEQAAQFTPCPP